MTIALIILAVLFLFREVQHSNATVRWQRERADLVTRIQAGSLQEYQQATTKPSAPVYKSREQRVAEQANDKGLMRQDLQYPPQWRG